MARTGGLTLRGLPACLLCRGLHSASMPGARRTLRLVNDWVAGVVLGRVGSDLGDIGPGERLVHVP